MKNKNIYEEVASLIKKSHHCVVFTGAGISVESGIPPFRGEGGLWNKYYPNFLYIDYYFQNPLKSWKILKEIFYNFFNSVKPNKAHLIIGELYKKGFIKTVITQNIDNLHQEGGCNNVIEFHGNLNNFVCLYCNKVYNKKEIIIDETPPICPNCKNILKPDIIFFGESIKEKVIEKSFDEIKKSDLLIICGTSGEVAPANNLPFLAKSKNSLIIEINKNESLYTNKITDIFIKDSAVIAFENIYKYF